MAKRIVGAGGGGGCFLGDTLVAVPGGTRRIDELKAGDQVLSFDDRGDIHAAVVLKVHEHANEQVVRYRLWGGKHLDATPNHWVLNQFNAFVEIGTLGADDCLVDWNNHLRPIVGKEDLGAGTVYNLTVEGHHTFIAGDIRVHNAGLGVGIAGSGGGGGRMAAKGGGGGGTSNPVESDDTLQSVQFASVLDLLSEGEIEGLDDGNKSIFLDNTPVQDAGGNDNFQGYTIVTRNGTQAQTHIAGDFGATEREQDVNVEVTNATSVTRSITDTDVDRVRVTLTIPALQVFEDDGDIVGNSVEIKIDVQYNGGGYNTKISDTISGKSSNRYQRDYEITLDGDFPVDIRMIRVSADETSNKRASSTFFQSYTEIIDEKFRYPNSALVGLRFDSRQFSSIPSRKYLIRGIKVKIPSNATVDTTTHLGRITYSGVWDGTFSAATWTNDPAWCLYDLLINDRYGAGVPEATLDRYDFFSISQYCNELVDDGKGGEEPRFTLNMLINSRDEVYNVIQEMTAIFRGIAYYSAGSLVLLQDKPADPQYLLGPSNVIEGVFQYSGSSQKARHTVATVSWQSYDTRGDIEYEYVEDHDAVAKYGIINKDIKAIGCYSQGQAHRIGKWALLSEQNLTETCQFSVGIESGIILRPGMVIDIADPLRAGARRSGRIRSATTTELVVDSSTNIDTSTATSENDPKISVMLPTGLVETRSIPAGGIEPQTNGTAIIDVDTAFSEAPNAGSVFLIQTSDLQSQQFRVVSVAESEGGIYGVTAVAYNSTIYDAVESDLALTTRDITNLSATPNPVDSINNDEFLYQEGQSIFVGSSVSWNHDRQSVTEFQVKYRIDNDNWQTVSTSSPSVTLKNLRAGTLYLQIAALNYLNKPSTFTSAEFVLEGKTAPPADVTGFSMIPTNGQARLSWNQAADLDVRVGGHVRIRHSPNLSSVTWSTSTSITDEIAGSSTETYADLKPGTYSIKFLDSGGRESVNAVYVEFTKADLDNVQNVGTQTEHSTFPGTKDDLVVDSGTGELELDFSGAETESEGEILSEDDTLITDEGGTDTIAQQGNDAFFTSGEYYFQNNPTTLSDVFSIKLDSTLRARAFFPYGDRIDNAPDFDAIADFDGDAPTDADVKLFIRTTQDDPTGSPTWTSWRRFNSAEFKARAYELRADFSTGANDEQIAVDQLSVEANMPIRTVTGSVTTSASADVSVAYGTGNKFYVAPSVGIVFTTNASGDYYVISNNAATGFDVSVYNSSDTRIAKTVNWTATGYGKG